MEKRSMDSTDQTLEPPPAYEFGDGITCTIQLTELTIVENSRSGEHNPPRSRDTMMAHMDHLSVTIPVRSKLDDLLLIGQDGGCRWEEA